MEHPMIEQLVIWSLVAISAFFLGRRLLRQLRSALDNKQPLSCGQGCCSCTAASSCQTDALPPKPEHTGEKV